MTFRVNVIFRGVGVSCGRVCVYMCCYARVQEFRVFIRSGWCDWQLMLKRYGRSRKFHVWNKFLVFVF
jgi:hypothetical protein